MSLVLEEPLYTAGSQLATEGSGKARCVDPSRSGDSPTCLLRTDMSPVLEEPSYTAGSQLATEGLGKGEWVDPSRSDDSPAKQLMALRQRLVAAERERKQSLAEAAAENRALQLQLQVTHAALLQSTATVFVCCERNQWVLQVQLQVSTCSICFNLA